MLKKLLSLFIFLSCILAVSQTTIKGTIFNEYLEPFPGATINSSSGGTTNSNFHGEFKLIVKELPIIITISSVGYSTEKVKVTEANKNLTLNVILKEAYTLNQVVMSASRTPERVMESPVTIERADSKFVKNTASPNFYEGLKNLKGIDLIDNNYLSKNVVSNRGFASTDNIRFVQLIDGVDSAVPIFEYSLGNTFGVNELDLKNVEILPGAASALYGANAFNGILLMTTKSPFDYTGVSVYTKSGVTTQEDRGAYAFYDVGARFAYKFNDWIAAKANVSYDKGRDWVANDLSNINGNGFSHLDGDSNYNGVNVYGDEVSLNLVDMALLASNPAFTGNPQSPLFGLNPLGLISGIENVEDMRVSRTGFAERNLIDYDVYNIKFDASVHFKPWGEDKTEIILASKFSHGDNISQLSNRYSQSDSSMKQYRFELKGQDYFFRAYYNENDSGNTYDTKLAGVYIGDQLIPNRDYFTNYSGLYFTALNNGATNANAHLIARQALDSAIDVNSTAFSDAFNNAKRTNISDGGAVLSDQSGFYNIDANINLADYIDFADIQFGGSFRSYALNSKGQIYTDDDGILRFRQYGFYSQLQKKFLDDRLKLTTTIRFDKSRNFNGNFSPRATLSYAAGEKKDHNFRVGFQTGFRNPTSQDQYSGVFLGNSILLGSVEENLSREQVTTNYVSDGVTEVTISGEAAFSNSFTAQSVANYQKDFRTNILNGTPGNVDINLLKTSNFELVKPEIVRSFELGYRGAMDVSGNLFEFDLVGYYNFHKDFITTTEVVVPFYGDVNDFTSGSATAISLNDFQRFEIATNSKSEITAYGFAAGFNTKIFRNLDFGASYAFSDYSINESDEDIDFEPAFNTPKHAIKLQLGGERVIKNLGFGINARWQDEFLYQTRFVDRILDARFVLDAQLNYNIPSIKSMIKVGGTNLTGKEYFSAPESGAIGSQYYISWTINN